ncbi:uncharacterized protein G2W53_040643 [Senna tora]|uniref:Uncharacterized protein n=2 Tax=Senna tora TaxID=362788 RepID=A0A834VY50_9FABA|nr:uncharacterized protein G2W53_040643 [Senna tora]
MIATNKEQAHDHGESLIYYVKPSIALNKWEMELIPTVSSVKRRDNRVLDAAKMKAKEELKEQRKKRKEVKEKYRKSLEDGKKREE